MSSRCGSRRPRRRRPSPRPNRRASRRTSPRPRLRPRLRSSPRPRLRRPIPRRSRRRSLRPGRRVSRPRRRQARCPRRCRYRRQRRRRDRRRYRRARDPRSRRRRRRLRRPFVWTHTVTGAGTDDVGIETTNRPRPIQGRAGRPAGSTRRTGLNGLTTIILCLLPFANGLGRASRGLLPTKRPVVRKWSRTRTWTR